ncbi:rRNA methyltransferase [Bacillus sp. FJAT-27225]|uniref:rRNA methyltransferase n=1 Tax=Bacillus sp. FJAT-27225 TaxID=1743144 RepID=UPI00080C2B36|nr:rRNA methyltransferase [Bacillus sp. FJAT-27225]OCA90711.1 rRNA methyltransferase [Bacillus sp. FJAT-27225]
MWKKVNGRLVQVVDDSRVEFRTNISKEILDSLSQLAKEHETNVNYLLETGLESVLDQGVITFNKEARPKDRVQYKTTYDKELLERIKHFAKNHNLYINDVLEYSAGYINLDKAKKEDYRHRIEK